MHGHNVSFKEQWHKGSEALLKAYDGLCVNDPVEPADLIVVLAGRMERKVYGLELFRSGVAPRLLLSIGRFEVSKVKQLDLEGYDRLVAMRDKLAPEHRHFFINIDSSGFHVEKAEIPMWSTYGEAIALRSALETRPELRNIIVLSNDLHLRRVRLTFGKVFSGTCFKFRYCPVPPGLTRIQREKWWTNPATRQYVLSEAVKLGGYCIGLSRPFGLVRQIAGIALGR